MAITYDEYKKTPQSEKIALVRLNASKRCLGFAVHSGSIYSVSFDHFVISVEDSGAALNSVSSIGAITPGDYFFDQANKTLYLETSGSTNPNESFLVVEVSFFFSNKGVSLSHDLDTGAAVHWLPLVKTTSRFSQNLDTRNQFGLALEGSGSVNLINDREFWGDIFDKWTFENRAAQVYSWAENLDPTDAKLLFDGKTLRKSWSDKTITFRIQDLLVELRAPVPLPFVRSKSGANVPDGLVNARQRVLYGFVHGHRPINIDAVSDNLILRSGTVSVTNGSSTVTGVGTSFLSDFTPLDNIFIDGDTDVLSIEAIVSDTEITLTEDYPFTNKSGAAYYIKANTPKRFVNRKHLIAGHELCEPSTTVTVASALNLISVADTQDLYPGDELTINGELTNIERISDQKLFLSRSLGTLPTVGDTVTRNSVQDVYLNSDLLIKDRDYTIDAAEAAITLDELAEVNIASIQTLIGSTLTFGTGTRTVTGASVNFKTDLNPGDFLTVSGQADFFEISSIETETSLTLKTLPSFTDTDTGQFKSPDVYVEGTSVLSLLALGKTDDGTKSGKLLTNASEIVRDLVRTAGIEDAQVNEASFDTSKELATQRLGLAIPETYDATESKEIRAIINRVNKSVFGSLIQDNEFKIKFNILNPRRDTTAELFTEGDLLSMLIQARADETVKTANINYLFKEWDAIAGSELNQQAQKITDHGRYLMKINREFSLDTVLVDLFDAQIMANRFAFLYRQASAIIKCKTKMQGMDLEINQQVALSHPKLYERIGSEDKIKVGFIQRLTKAVEGAEFELVDLGNTLSIAGAITENTQSDFDGSTAQEKAVSGYITDDFGTINNDADTAGINLIW